MANNPTTGGRLAATGTDDEGGVDAGDATLRQLLGIARAGQKADYSSHMTLIGCAPTHGQTCDPESAFADGALL